LPDDIAPFGILQGKLLQWGGVQPSHISGCQALADSARAIPAIPLLDGACPTVMVLRALKQAGWMQNGGGKVVHNAGNVQQMICDARGGVKQKRYLQCLLDWPKCLQLTSAIPSNASQKFYQCLLNGKSVEPFRSATEYGNVLMDADPVLALQNGEDDADEVDSDGGEMVVAGTVGALTKKNPKPKPKPKPKAVAFDFLPIADVSEPLHSSGGQQQAVVAPHPKAPPSPSSASASGLQLVPSAPPERQDDEDEIVVARAGGNIGTRRFREYIPAVGGIGMVFKDVYSPTTGAGYTNWIFKFDFGGRQWEKKRLVTAASTRRHGPLEPLAFLHAWRDLVVESGGAVGPRQAPSAAAIDGQFSLHRDEFNVIFNRF